MTEPKPDIRQLSLEALEQWFVSQGEKPYRAKQVYEWLWNKNAGSFDEMTNLGKALRQKLKEAFRISKAGLQQIQQSADGTLKNAVGLPDGLVVESVVIPSGKRLTVCISSQVGCSLDCRFCATARLKRMRNLSAGEIVDQVVQAREQSKEYFDNRLTNIVFMGMGEPLLNYDNVLRAIRIMTDPKGLGISPKRIVLSTAGIPKMIKRLADDDPGVGLAVSLHAAQDEVRNQIMPVNSRTGGLKALAEALQYWYDKTGRKITFEYMPLAGINDNDEALKALVRYASQIPSKVNLIRYNPTDSFDPFRQADEKWFEKYRDTLQQKGIVATIRQSAGADIDAACGQLAGKWEKDTPSIPYKKLRL